ncbi:hypothetical protein Ngar_c35060 [Candidatus Nitrososphaera gargensis Ga9.2]|uniref:Uncharacterized protein n=1 Tax=Nitrososphaera gargensis (strain Ga9.2) TaxID=1237085 RepID=K0IP32_NITGG|nr:hypothetical protein Ngar_c35060 [Candidatus Nitrososphaera gargensis Ga9.2]
MRGGSFWLEQSQAQIFFYIFLANWIASIFAGYVYMNMINLIVPRCTSDSLLIDLCYTNSTPLQKI